MGQSCRDSFSPLSSYHTGISSYAPQDPEAIRLDVDESSDCAGKNDQDVKNKWA